MNAINGSARRGKRTTPDVNRLKRRGRSSPPKTPEREGGRKRSEFTRMALQNKLRKLIFEGSSTRKTLKLIKYLQEKNLLMKKVKCRICHQRMKLAKKRGRDHYSW